MKKLLVLALVAIALCFSACKEPHVTPINPLAKALFAPGGNDSKWDYTDLRATNPDERVFSVTVSDYEAYEIFAILIGRKDTKKRKIFLGVLLLLQPSHILPH